EVQVDAYPVPVAAIEGDNALCEGETVVLSAPEGAFSYYWNTDETTQNIEISAGGEYSVKLSNICGEDIALKNVDYHPLPDVDIAEYPYQPIEESVVLVPGSSVTLDAGQYVSYDWNKMPGDTTQYYIVNYDAVGEGSDTIAVDVFDGFCYNKDYVIIEVLDIKVPAVITPNGDGANDTFTPMNDFGWSAVKDHTIMVFNRWGDKVWESGDFLSGWNAKQNGRIVADGTYYWILEVFYGDDNVKKVFKGTLTVLGTTK
ncbi:MAG: gliding motility-associated C-terminal domain-containing protein, partial [Bacteroidales bacterium]|nr:gliding motility-associated C-terminal domain-containing protein [Bacteroidales bacterium]